MYRAGVEWILGFRLRGEVLRLDPCVPRSWPGFSMTFRYHSARYEIEVENPAGAMRGVGEATLDGEPTPVDGEGARIPLTDDGAVHRVRLRLAADGPASGGESPHSPGSDSPTPGERTPPTDGGDPAD
jgi:cyclic beta-1,2-glucan synthetase